MWYKLFFDFPAMCYNDATDKSSINILLLICFTQNGLLTLHIWCNIALRNSVSQIKSTTVYIYWYYVVSLINIISSVNKKKYIHFYVICCEIKIIFLFKDLVSLPLISRYQGRIGNMFSHIFFFYSGRASPTETKSEKSSQTQLTSYSSGTGTGLGTKLRSTDTGEKLRRLPEAFISIQMEKVCTIILLVCLVYGV